MTNKFENTETVKESGKLENIKQLNVMNQSGSEVVSLLNNIKDTKRKLESLLSEQRQREKALEQKRNEQKIQVEASKPKLERFPDEVVTESAKVTTEVSPAKVAPVENIKPNIEKQAEKTEVTTQSKQPIVAPTTASTVAPAANTNNIRTKQFDQTPSYIRGTYTPAPPPPKTPRPPYNNNNNFNNNAPRPFNNNFNNNGPRPGGAPFNNNGARPFNNNFNNPRPQGSTGGFAPGGVKRPIGSSPKPDMPLVQGKFSKPFDPKKKDYAKAGDDKKAMTKRTLIRKGFIQENFDEERMGARKLKNKKNIKQLQFIPQKIEKAIITTENLTVKILSEKIGKTAQEIIKQLMVLGIMTNINSVVDFPTMELVANELGVELELKLEQTKAEILEADHDEVDEEVTLKKRPPIITVMGHVDHGKTSLLDAIRKTTVASGEAGGITQHIGAYSVVCKSEKITFLDTPGHEAFTEMRARGAKVTDIAILVVAADDGIMPQTIEAINHAKLANIPIIVAINKIDKPAANVEKIKQTLTEYGLVTEEWGGDTIMVPISAKVGTGIDKLLESILLLAEVNNYRANPDRKAKGSVIEAKLDKGKGPVANVIIQNGTLKVGDIVVSGITSGRIRAMTDDKGKNIKEAAPSTPVSILGFTDVPNAGDIVFVVNDDKVAKQVVAERTAIIKSSQSQVSQKVTIEDMFNKISDAEIKDFNIVIKADVQGSLEALTNSLAKLVNEEARANIIHGGVGAINKSDLMLAEVSKAVIIGFNVKPDAETKQLAESNGVDIKLYKVIYEAIEAVEKSLKGLLTIKYREIITGRVQVRNVFKITGSGIVAGSYVTSGKIFRNSKARVFRNGELIYTGSIHGLKRFKDDVKDVAEGYECGVSLDNFSELKELDEIEAYTLEEIIN